MDTSYGGYTDYRRSLTDPANEQAAGGYSSLAGTYRYRWHLYQNTIFEDVLKWVAYKQRYRLYRSMRSVYNPVNRLVELYAGIIYGGVITEDGLSLPNGTPSAVPLGADTDELLRKAATQLWRWSNWQQQKSLYVRFGSALGDAFLEVIEDSDRQKTWIQVWWPGYVTGLDLDPQGNVKAYALEYRVNSTPGNPSRGYAPTPGYLFRKEVDQEYVRWFKDGRPFDYGWGTVSEHGYGFCPGAWVMPKTTGGNHGMTVWDGSQAKIEELNGLISRIHDQIHKAVASPRIFWTSSTIKSLTKKTPSTSPLDVDEVSQPDGDRDSVLLLKGPPDGRSDSLLGDLDIASTAPYLEKLLLEIEADHPELTVWKELRAMSQVTGPGAMRMIGDSVPRFMEAGSAFDRGLTAVTQMGIAIAGQRIKDGEWDSPDRHQEAFAPFDLDSYSKGELDMVILPRLVVDSSPDEKLDQAIKKQTLGVDGATLLAEIGYGATQIAKITAAKKKEQQASIEQQAQAFAAGGRGGTGGGAFE